MKKIKNKQVAHFSGVEMYYHITMPIREVMEYIRVLNIRIETVEKEKPEK